MEIISFNVNGIRAISKKNFFEDMQRVNADVICLQETKATAEQVKETVADQMSSYSIFANDAERKGYSGTAILSKTEPLSVSYDMGIEEHDKEGRVICAEFNEYYVITVYVPNSGNDLRRLEYRQRWDADFLNYLKGLEENKPVIVCGDFNVAHTDIDLARPKPNYNKSAGYMQEEINGMDAYTSSGLVDSFRAKSREEVKYSWWSYRGGARDRNVGWRIDYLLASEGLLDRVEDAFILNDVHGSDHCPVGIKIN
ncbi:MAG: exodeoxyribonuclease III [Crocinitomicaceae bacterium]|nr:exodeoxyribonuclease III [Crocinitomicaceae bacterium]